VQQTGRAERPDLKVLLVRVGRPEMLTCRWNLITCEILRRATLFPVSFKHNPLSNQSFIRLVEIHTGRSGGDVACSIEEYSETARRDCRLLFYMWADADKDKVILLSGKKVFCGSAEFVFISTASQIHRHELLCTV
jgi:hypothetical protein